ncbi:hypothetical protein [Mannheimia indoligenes]|uniref:hypothetical protein n=1 Tax=Mannheimia indoligenes TaxID=3103145 RepID=UPI002FE5C767
MNKFINSSLFIAFLTITSFSTAYCYGWGQALFYGYPWWHVEIDNASIARSLAYVSSISIILLLSYTFGYYLVNKIFKLHYFSHLGWLRVIVLVSIFTIPVILTFYLFIGFIPIYIDIIYLTVTTLCVVLFQKKWNNTVFILDFMKLLNKNTLWIFNLFILVYFALLALYIGYLRSDLRETYDYIKLDGKEYYILSTDNNNRYILGEQTKNNSSFILFNRDSQTYYEIYVTKIKLD